jgi:ABC-2 type transport system ATP-binding protein
VGEYSKGMQRRIGLAQSLINDPQLLILDEPTSGMDPVGAKQIKDLIATLAARGKTVLLCSHLLGDVEDLCDRVAIMYGGRVRAEGTCDDLLEQEHATLLETAELPEPVIAEVREVLRRHDLSLTRVQRPRRTLESLFLEIVERARAEGVQTSGARSGGAVAGFLGGDADVRRAGPGAAGSGPAGSGAAEGAGSVGDAAAAVDAGLLESLVAPSADERTIP